MSKGFEAGEVGQEQQRIVGKIRSAFAFSLA
jgi:hypothetical protein